VGYSPTQPTGLRRGHARSGPAAPQLFPKSLRKRSGNWTNHVVRQLLTKNGQGSPDGVFNIIPRVQASTSLNLGDELLVTHLILLLRY
jgi:hypothetical protein